MFDSFLRERYPRATPSRLAGAVRELSDAFTSERSRLPASYMNQPPARSAYAAYFHPRQVLCALAALEEVRARADARGLWPAGTGDAPQVLDLGAGLGAMSQALLSCHDGDAWPDIALVDRQRAVLRDARSLVEAVAVGLRPDARPPRVRTAAEDALTWLRSARRNGWRYDVVLVGAMLNEHEGAWGAILGALLAVLAPGAAVVVLEPALPAVARRLMELRQGALNTTTTIAPCTHGGACPLLELSRDWCFTTREARLPPHVEAHARSLGHQTHEVRYALWAFVVGPEAAPFPGRPADRGRVVTDAMSGEVVVCSDARRVRTAAPRGAVRGDLVER